MNARRLTVLALLIVVSTLSAHTNGHAAGSTTLTGTINGAAYTIEVPNPWNGTLVLYSHGYVFPDAPQ